MTSPVPNEDPEFLTFIKLDPLMFPHDVAWFRELGQQALPVLLWAREAGLELAVWKGENSDAPPSILLLPPDDADGSWSVELARTPEGWWRALMTLDQEDDLGKSWSLRVSHPEAFLDLLPGEVRGLRARAARNAALEAALRADHE